MISQRIRAKEFDVLTFCVALSISVIGIIAIFSAVHGGSRENDRLWIAQIIRLSVALVAMSVAIFIDYRIWEGFAYIFYGLCFILLSVLLAFPEQSGVRRWFMKGAIQPSELAKIILIMTVAKYLSDNKRVSGQLRVFVIALIIVMAYALLIFMQPSLGYALTLIPIALSMFYIGGINEMYLLLLIIPGLVSVSTTILILHKGWDIASKGAFIRIAGLFAAYSVIVFLFYLLVSKTRIRNGQRWVKFISACIFIGIIIALVGSGLLKDYQKNRVLAFVNPNFDPKGAGYHIIQSKIAIGSGGLIGQGYLQGTQNRLDFLPAQHTDFIFSVVAEEKGFLGVLLILILYFILIMSGLKAADRADDPFGALLATGLIAMIATQMFMNIGMTLGLMPITGVPLPLMSYGGSSLISTFISIGLLINVRLKRE
jgi:rod shape determining protein RodA